MKRPRVVFARQSSGMPPLLFAAMLAKAAVEAMKRMVDQKKP
jgi:hypothetical protein